MLRGPRRGQYTRTQGASKAPVCTAKLRRAAAPTRQPACAKSGGAQGHQPKLTAAAHRGPLSRGPSYLPSSPGAARRAANFKSVHGALALLPFGCASGLRPSFHSCSACHSVAARGPTARAAHAHSRLPVLRGHSMQGSLSAHPDGSGIGPRPRIQRVSDTRSVAQYTTRANTLAPAHKSSCSFSFPEIRSRCVFDVMRLSAGRPRTESPMASPVIHAVPSRRKSPGHAALSSAPWVAYVERSTSILREGSTAVLVSAALRSCVVDQFLLSGLALRLRVLRRLLRRLARVELLDDLGADTVKLLFGEYAQQRPREIQRVENASSLVGACKGVVFINLKTQISNPTRIMKSYVPWPTKPRSNLSRNSSANLSSGDNASSPTTAFIAAASRPIAYLAYWIWGGGLDNGHHATRTRVLTSWFETSPWSFLVNFSPMALFIKRERDGRTLIGG